MFKYMHILKRAILTSISVVNDMVIIQTDLN